MLKPEENGTESKINIAIEKAIEKREQVKKEIQDILDDFIIESIVEYLIDGPVVMTVYGSLKEDGLVLSSNTIDGAMIEYLYYDDFSHINTNRDILSRYLSNAVNCLGQRASRIIVEADSEGKTFTLHLN